MSLQTETVDPQRNIEIEQPEALENRAGNESYYQLVWQRFRRSKAAIFGGLLVLVLIILAIFAEFFSPVDPTKSDLQNSFIPPTRIRFVDAEGTFHLRPFVYNQEVTIDMTTFEPIWEEDTSTRYPIRFFVRS